MEIGSGSIETSEGFFISCRFQAYMLSCMGFSCFVEVPQATPAAVPQQGVE